MVGFIFSQSGEFSAFLRGVPFQNIVINNNNLCNFVLNRNGKVIIHIKHKQQQQQQQTNKQARAVISPKIPDAWAELLYPRAREANS